MRYIFIKQKKSNTKIQILTLFFILTSLRFYVVTSLKFLTWNGGRGLSLCEFYPWGDLTEKWVVDNSFSIAASILSILEP